MYVNAVPKTNPNEHSTLGYEVTPIISYTCSRPLGHSRGGVISLPNSTLALYIIKYSDVSPNKMWCPLNQPDLADKTLSPEGATKSESDYILYMYVGAIPHLILSALRWGRRRGSRCLVSRKLGFVCVMAILRFPKICALRKETCRPHFKFGPYENVWQFLKLLDAPNILFLALTIHRNVSKSLKLNLGPLKTAISGPLFPDFEGL
eukprot:sb/3470428/